MGSIRALVFRRILAAGLILTLAAVAGLMLAERTRPVAHQTPHIRVGMPDSTSVGIVGTPTSLRVTTDEPAEEHLLIAAEIEHGSNDPDDGISYGTPDRHCRIPAGDFDCILEFDWFVPATGVIVRIFVSSPSVVVDSFEGPRLLGVSFNEGCLDEPDSTEVVQFSVLPGPASGNHPEPHSPVEGADPDPATCENAGPTATATPSDSGTPTETGTAEPTATATPTETMTATPTATATADPVVIASPFEGRYREHRCHRYLPANADAPCEASGEAFAESGLAHALAAVRLAEGEPATMTQADASAGVIHPASVDGPRMIVARLRVHEASIQARPASPTIGSPYGGVEVWVHVESHCAVASSMMTLPIDGSGSIENQVVEIRVEYDGCETLTSIQAGVRAVASTTPGAAGAVRAEITASIERITVQ